MEFDQRLPNFLGAEGWGCWSVDETGVELMGLD